MDLHHPPNNNSNSSSSTPPPPPPRRHHHPTPHSSPPCGACKFLRRKCVDGCVFAPYFGTEQGAARFAAVHKVFGASNVSKLLLQMPALRRHDAVLTVCYEAQARLSDPVYGCVSTILALQQQVASLQTELTILQSQLISSRLAVASALQVQGSSSVSEYPLPQHITVLHPSYSNNSISTSNSMVMNLTSCFHHASCLDPSVHDAHDHDQPVSEGLEHLHHHPSHQDEDDEEAEGESRTSSAVFADTVFHTK